MKRLILLCLFAPVLAIAQPRKHALVIAIADYPEESGWGDISSDKDIQLVRPVYEHQGFTDMILIQDKDASKEGIINGFKQLADKCKAGDVVLIHYSGHGQQIFDDNGDEPDGLDESLVAWGAPAEYEKGYNGEKHLRDDEFGSLIADLRSKLGKQGSVLVIVDACHSGTASRGAAKKRGGKSPIIPPHFKISDKKENGPGYNVSEAKSRGQQMALAPMVLISASSFDEENSETFDDNGVAVGSLSYAMARSLNQCKEQQSYRALFSQILHVMNEKVPHQTPMLEGDIDYTLFAGNLIAQKPFFTVKEVLPAGNEVVMYGGSLVGVNAGSKVMICPAGSTNSNVSDKAVEARVVSVNANHSVLKPVKPLKGNASDYWVFMKTPALAKLQLKYKLAAASEAKWATAIAAGFKSEMLVADKNSPDVLIDEVNGYLRFVRASDGFVLDSVRANADAAKLLGYALSAYAQNKYLRDFRAGSINSLTLQLIPADIDGESKKQTDIMQLKAGSQVKVKVINSGNQKLYFNIIDIQPDGKINPMIPGPQELTLKHAEQYVLAPGEEKILPYPFEIAPPYGNEVFKVFASTEPFNITPYIANGSLQTRGGTNGTVLNAFIQSEVGTRGVTGGNNASDALYTSEVMFKIIR